MPDRHRQRRNTAKQQAVLSALRASDRFRSAQQLYIDLRQDYSLQVGLTSIYRILHGLAEEQVAETQRAENGEILYRARRKAEHRHYLLCRRCGNAVGFTAPAIEEHTDDLARHHDYAEVTHYVDLYGICPLCRRTTTER
jgi:Fur family transcriptional regulator, ferric uptake regulator